MVIEKYYLIRSVCIYVNFSVIEKVENIVYVFWFGVKNMSNGIYFKNSVSFDSRR